MLVHLLPRLRWTRTCVWHAATALISDWSRYMWMEIIVSQTWRQLLYTCCPLELEPHVAWWLFDVGTCTRIGFVCYLSFTSKHRSRFRLNNCEPNNTNYGKTKKGNATVLQTWLWFSFWGTLTHTALQFGHAWHIIHASIHLSINRYDAFWPTQPVFAVRLLWLFDYFWCYCFIVCHILFPPPHHQSFIQPKNDLRA